MDNYKVKMLPINEDNISKILLSAPIGICILHADTLVCESVNEKFLEIAGKPYEAIFGKSYWEPFAEAKPYYEQALISVLKTGDAYFAKEVEMLLIRHGQPEWVYVTFVYSPIKNPDGKVVKVVVWVLENTNQVKSRKAINDLNEQLTVTNEEIQSTNEELNVIQSQLEATNLELIAGRDRFREMIHSLPVAMLVTRGEDFIVEEANGAMLVMIGKNALIVGKPLFEIVPEFCVHSIQYDFMHAYRIGKLHKVSEVPLTFTIDGQPKYGFYDITYSALIEKGKVTGVMQSIADVTNQIVGRNKVASAYEQARLSKEAARFGTFDMDLVHGSMEWDARCRILFGITHEDKVTYEEDFLRGLHPDDRDRIIGVIENVFKKSLSNGVYDVEYRTIGVEDKILRWVRAKGQAYFDHNDKPVRFIGAVFEITEQKEDEQRKNGFVSMVSHELKTPLTSLKALIQLTQAKLEAVNEPFLQNAMGKANMQVKKMVSMIDGFLNISRLQSGKLYLNMQKFNIDELIREIIDELAITTVRHEIKFSPCSPIQVNADKDKIGHVISNLLSNAIKYSPDGITIEVECMILSGAVQVSITDHGIGIKKENISSLFNRFYRVEGDNMQNIAGFGIGLYLSAEIVQAHKGKIWVDSEPGNGSTFNFSLPT